MKTTLVIDDGVARRFKAEAARRGRTLSELVEAALRRFLDSREERPAPERLPSWRGGRARVDVGNRDALEAAMDEDGDEG